MRRPILLALGLLLGLALALAAGCADRGDGCDPVAYGQRCGSDGQLLSCRHVECSDGDGFFDTCDSSATHVVSETCGSLTCAPDGPSSASCMPRGVSLACTADPSVGMKVAYAQPLVAADFDGDGKSDVVGFAGPRMKTLLHGDTLGAEIDLGMEPSMAAAGDEDGDGHLDLLVGGVVDAGGTEPRLEWMLGDGHGGFGSAVPLDAKALAGSIEVADVDGDGKADVVAAEQGREATTVRVYRGGALDLAPSAKTVATTASLAGTGAHGDFDGDGHVDLLAVQFVDGKSAALVVLYGDGEGGFVAGARARDADLIETFAVADLDGDRIDDVVVSGVSDGTLRVWRGRSDRTLAAVGQGVPLPVSPAARILVGDVDGDGAPDVLAAFGATHALAVLHGDGHGSFAAARVFDPTHTDAVLGALGDTDGDGRLDAVVVSEGAYLVPEVRIVRGACGAQ